MPSTEEKLLDAGARLMLERGYAATGVATVLEDTRLTKGSFYHHFSTKEEFAIAAIDRWFEGQAAVLERHLEPSASLSAGGLAAYLAELGDLAEESGWRRGCLLGTLGQETSPDFEPLRLRISGHFLAWQSRLGEALAALRERGSIAFAGSPAEVAALLIDAWEGALMAAKVQRSRAPLDRFVSIALPAVLQTTPRPEGNR